MDGFTECAKKTQAGASRIKESTRDLWTRLWSTARIHLGLSSAEFYAMTPRKLGYLIDRFNELRQHEEFLHGILCSSVINSSQRAPKVPRTPSDFMPSEMNKPKGRKYTKRDALEAGEAMRASLNSLVRK